MFFGRRKKNNCGDSAIPAILLLNAAATAGDLAEVKRLVIDCGIDPNKGVNGRTPLREAAAWGHPEVVEFLLEHGADPNIRNNEGDTPLDYGSNCEEIIEEFMRGGTRTTVYE